MRFTTAIVRCTKEENAVGAGVDGMEMRDLGGGAAFRICQCWLRPSAPVFVSILSGLEDSSHSRRFPESGRKQVTFITIILRKGRQSQIIGQSEAPSKYIVRQSKSLPTLFAGG